MPGSEREVVQKLIAHKNELADLVTSGHFERHPELVERYGEEGRTKCYEDTISHLDYLEQAVRIDSKELFNNYLNWARTRQQEQDIPKGDLVDNIVVIREEIEKLLPDKEAAILVDIINEGLSYLEDRDIERITFFNSDDLLDEEARTYLDLLLAGKRKKAADLIEGLVEDGTSIKDIYEHIFQKTQYEIGALWQTNQVTVAQEHYCTAATQLIMSRLYPKIFAMEKSDKRLVACSVADELHEIGIRMVTDFFEMEGWDTYYLGANMPDDHLIKSIKENNADVLAISVTIPLHISKAKNLIQILRDDRKLDEVKVIVGGYPFKKIPDLWKKIGADGWAESADDAIETANKLIAN